jgi:hypothetical protein
VTHSRSLVCIHIISLDCRQPLVIVRFPPLECSEMSHYAQPADNTILYHSIHSTPPRRPGAGVSRRNSLPLPSLLRTQTESSTVSVTSTPHQGVGGNTSFLWPWHKPAVHVDDREKMALFPGEKHNAPTVSMKPWEGWRVVVIGSC